LEEKRHGRIVPVLFVNLRKEEIWCYRWIKSKERVEKTEKKKRRGERGGPRFPIFPDLRKREGGPDQSRKFPAKDFERKTVLTHALQGKGISGISLNEPRYNKKRKMERKKNRIDRTRSIKHRIREPSYAFQRKGMGRRENKEKKKRGTQGKECT